MCCSDACKQTQGTEVLLLQISNRYRYRIVVVNAARAPVQIRAVSVGLPDCITIKHSALLFVPVRLVEMSLFSVFATHAAAESRASAVTVIRDCVNTLSYRTLL